MWQNWHQPGAMMGYDGGGWFWGMAFHGLSAILFIAVLAVVLSPLFRWLGAGHQTHATTQSGGSALDILKARYARGEIDRDDYLQRKADLS